MHTFHSRENIKKKLSLQDLIFSWERDRKIGTIFFLYSQYGLREATLYGISVSFLRETTIGESCKQKVRVA